MRILHLSAFQKAIQVDKEAIMAETKLKQFDETPTDKAERQKHEQELKSSQSYIDEQVEKCIQENPDTTYDEDRIKKLAEEKKKREEERWRRFHFFKD